MILRRHAHVLGLLVLAAAAATASGTLSAASWTWDPDGSHTLGGAGTWSAASSNWWDGAVENAWTGPANDATFAGTTGGGVILSGSLSAGNITFSTTGYTLSAGTLTLVVPHIFFCYW